MGGLAYRRPWTLQGPWYMDPRYKAQNFAELLILRKEELVAPRAWDLQEPLLQNR